MGLKQQIVGTFNTLVTVVEFTAAATAIGSKERTQQTVKQVWAAVHFKNSAEDHNGKIFNINQRSYIMHYDAVIAAKNLQDLAVVDNGLTYYVTGADPKYLGLYILLNTEARA